MASEPGASLVLNAGPANGTAGRWSAFWTNQAALSITLVVGTFFLVINLLLFAAIYRRNRCRDRSGARDGPPPDKQVTSLPCSMSNDAYRSGRVSKRRHLARGTFGGPYRGERGAQKGKRPATFCLAPLLFLLLLSVRDAAGKCPGSGRVIGSDAIVALLKGLPHLSERFPRRARYSPGPFLGIALIKCQLRDVRAAPAQHLPSNLARSRVLITHNCSVNAAGRTWSGYCQHCGERSGRVNVWRDASFERAAGARGRVDRVGHGSAPVRDRLSAAPVDRAAGQQRGRLDPAASVRRQHRVGSHAANVRAGRRRARFAVVLPAGADSSAYG